MIPSTPDIGLRVVGAALAGASIVFAAYMVACGGDAVRVFGMEHLAIFAQPRGLGAAPPPLPSPSAPAPVSGPVVDMASTGSLAPARPKAPAASAPPKILAARSDRLWLKIGAAILSAAPGDDIPGLGRLGAIVRRDGGWAALDDKGAVLLTLPGGANGAALFSRRLIFD
jgi:hypothetical protein